MKLYIKNFQNISEETIDIEGFTVLTGKSNSGKSTIRRAIECVLYNVWEKGFIKLGETTCIIRITFDEKNWIQVVKPDNQYTVMLEGVQSIYPKVGKAVVPELWDMGLNYFEDSDGMEYDVHVRKQIAPWFFINSSKQEQSRIISSIFDFDQIKNIIKKSYQDKQVTNSKAEAIAKDIDKLKINKDIYSSKVSLYKRLHDLAIKRNGLQEFEERRTQCCNLEKRLNRLQTVQSAVGLFSKSLKNYLATLSYQERFLALSAQEDSLSSLKLRLELTNESLNSVEKLIHILEEREIISLHLYENSSIERLEHNIKTAKSLLSKNTYKSSIVNGMLKIFRDKTLATKYAESNREILFKSMELKQTQDLFNQTKLVRNKLIRYTSLSRYIDNYNTNKTGNIEQQTLQNEIKHIDYISSRATDFIEISTYLENMVRINQRGSEVDIMRNGLIDIQKEIESTRGFLVCPECGCSLEGVL